MSVPISAFLFEVVPYAPDVSDPSALFAIRSAAIEFCRRTMVWQARGLRLPVVPGQRVYAHAIPLDSQRVAMTRAWLEDRPLEIVSEDTLTGSMSFNWRTREGVPMAIVERPDNTFELSHEPDENVTGFITYDLALAPSRDADELGLDDLYDKHLEVIAAGALMRLYRTMGQPYYNYELSLDYERRFRAGVNRALNDVNRGNGRGTTRVTSVPFARGRTRR